MSTVADTAEPTKPSTKQAITDATIMVAVVVVATLIMIFLVGLFPADEGLDVYFLQVTAAVSAVALLGTVFGLLAQAMKSKGFDLAGHGLLTSAALFTFIVVMVQISM